MINKKEFDNIIRRNIIRVTGRNDFGYNAGKPYENYYSIMAFNDFLHEMQLPQYKSHYDRYKIGSGSELKPHGLTPPKMASAASSSRFCYLALRDGAEALGCSGRVIFEHECRITGISGTAPQLDAYIPDMNTYIEVKCHEIFDSHKVILKEKYHSLFFGEGNAFGFEKKEKPSTDSFELPLSLFGISDTSSMFDIKQLLCHLLGIASCKEQETHAKLIYLFFKPKTISPDEQIQTDEVFNRLCNEIRSIFCSAPIKKFTAHNNIILSAAAEYSEVMERLSKDNIIYLF